MLPYLCSLSFQPSEGAEVESEYAEGEPMSEDEHPADGDRDDLEPVCPVCAIECEDLS